jgi:hypothetical protein
MGNQWMLYATTAFYNKCPKLTFMIPKTWICNTVDYMGTNAPSMSISIVTQDGIALDLDFTVYI